MKKLTLTFLLLALTLSVYCQTAPSFNFNFEITEKGMPSGWTTFGSSNYSLSIDSTTTKSGKYSACIEFKEGDPNFKALGFTLPKNYSGKKITLTGYIKTENVTGGFAGLCVRIDPAIAFDNMQNRGIKGTSDWTKYAITLPMNPEKTEQIAIGAVLAGKGKIWIDDFTVTVDGKDIKSLKPFERKLLPAQKDKEFDKGSQITSIQVDDNKIKNLKDLGLIWGFLKYHHPNIAKGDYNWDYELFRILPKLLDSENQKSRDEILTKWIDSLGEFSVGKATVNESPKIKTKPDLDWITASAFSDELTASLLNVQNAKRSNDHYYIGIREGIGSPEFKNELTNTSIAYPDAGFRLLALYRYWNMIQYYFPYKYLIEEDWKNVLEEFIPKVANAKNETEYTLTMLELIGRLNDTHANISAGNTVANNYFGLNYAPVEVKFIENQAVVTGYYDEKLGKETGLEIGDIITTINKHPVEEIVKNKLKLAPASNYPTKLSLIAPDLLRTNDPTIDIEFTRNDKRENTVLKTFTTKQINIYSRSLAKDSCFKYINKDIAYINNGSLKVADLPKIWKEIEKTKGLIIDNRNYPSYFAAGELCQYLLPKSTPFIKFSNGSVKNPGLFTLTKPDNLGKKNKGYYKGKVIILTNEISISAAESHAMAYRVHPNATVIGSTTAAADGVVSPIYLPGGILTQISGTGVYYPDGKETQRIGIVPDIEIKPTIQGIKDGKDELIEKAIKVINQSSTNSDSSVEAVIRG
ncbi:MAG: S41 family peptidase [Flavobacterium sp.]